MKHYLLFALSIFCLLSSEKAIAQNLSAPCGDDYWREKALQDPVFLQKSLEFEQGILQIFEQKKASSGQPEMAKVVPVVVHIIHDGGPENLSDAKVLQAIITLNQALANQGSFNQGSGADCGIQLCMAQRTPEGQPSNGITRDQSPLTEMLMESQDLQVKNLNRWKPTDYINIWVVRNICSSTYGCGVYGYANYPFAHGSTIDGIVIEAAYLAELSKIAGLAHEVGHYFGLYHTFEGGCTNTNCLTQGDRICDTPPDQSTAGVPCGDNLSSCSTDTQSGPFTTDQPDMTWNFMDYGILACFHDYTSDQATRMNATLDGIRKSLLDSKGCLPPCPANTVAAFTASATSVGVGASVNFTNTSQNAAAYSWTVNGTPFSNLPNASYTFLAPGIYTIALSALPTNSSLCYADDAQLTIQVSCQVTASFTVSNITPNENETIFLTNTSQNAPETEWLVNGLSQGPSLDSINFNNPGAYEIRLITGNGVCSDTSTEFVYVLGVCLNKTFETIILTFNYSTFAKSVTYLTDGNMLIAGFGQETNNSTNRALFLTKIKPDGELVWKKKVLRDNTVGNSMVARATPDGGFVAFWGEGTLSLSTGHFYLTKFTSDGTISWTNDIEWSSSAGTQSDADILVNSDGSFVVCGPLLAKYTADGNPVWSKDLYGANRIKPHPDGGFIVLGSSEILRYDNMGTMLWRRIFGLTPFFSALDGLVMPDGSIFLSGIEVINASVINHGVLLKLDPTGAVVWSKKYRQSPSSTYRFDAITRAVNGNLILAGSALADDAGPGNFNDYRLMLEVDLNGDIQWSRHRFGKVILNDLVASPGGGYVMVGDVGDALIGESKLWLLKTDEKGRTGIPNCQDLPHQIDVYSIDVTNEIDLTVPQANFSTKIPANLQVAPMVFDWILESICPPACQQSFEICNNNLDDDGDGLFDCLDSECACTEDRCDPKQGDIWYFGNYCGLNFNTDPPTLLLDGLSTCDGISATMCDVKGRLLFYTDGQKVYNRFHDPMLNGSFLMSDSVYQSIIIPNPGNSNQYYVVVNYPIGQTRYSLVDMTLQGGHGDIVANQKNILFNGVVSGLAAVKACSFSGYWLLTRALGSSSFKAYRMDQNGLNPVPISSNTGQNVAIVQQIKISPDGKRVACTHFSADTNTAVLTLFDFDPYSSGVVSNPRVLSEILNSNVVWGVEFSPNGRYLYATGSFPGNVKLVQFDLEAGDLQAIKNSRVKLATLPGQGFGYPQLTPNGQIYLPAYSYTDPPPNFLVSVIYQPNAPGLACQYQHQVLDISDNTFSSSFGFGFCNVIASNFVEPQTPKLALTAQDTICELNTPVFYQIEDVQCGVDSITWKTENLSAQIIPNYQYATIRYLAPGAGRLIITAYTPCGIRTDTLNVLVVAPLTQSINLGPDLVVCQNGVFSFNAGSGFAKYLWSDGTADSTVTTLFPGTYWVKAWDLCGNFQTDTITVSIAPNSVLDLGPDLPQQCSGFSANYQRPANFESWQWSPNVFLSCADCPSVTISPAASTRWIVIGQTAEGCISVDTLNATIRDTLLFSRDTFVCVGETLALFGTQLPADTTAEFFLPALALGCDTLLTVNVLGIDNATSEVVVRICADAFFEYNGVLLPADTVVVFHFSNALACDSAVTVRVNAYPALTLSLPMDTTIRIGASVLLDAELLSTGTLDFFWTPTDGLSCFACPDPLANPLDTITYMLSVTDLNGCTAQESVTVRVNEECRVRIPNAFTPNGDGSNEVFRPVLDPCVRTVRLWKILNRWGQTVFEQVNFSASDPNLGWDGNWDGKPQPSDVLIWVAEFEYFDGRREAQSGEVSLIR